MLPYYKNSKQTSRSRPGNFLFAFIKQNLQNYGIGWRIQKEQDKKCPLAINQPIVWRRKTQNPKVTVTKSGSLEFPKLTSKRPWTKRIIVFFLPIFPTQTLSHLDYNFFSYLRFKTDTRCREHISAKTATLLYAKSMVVYRAPVFNILEGR